ncbi:MAG: flagellar basal body P-ring formation chaperone FlgA [Planctomycetota bacterium]|nr:flagellar basal body P-ring formation chaperone FlgA [Planctomycetota bacterium]
MGLLAALTLVTIGGGATPAADVTVTLPSAATVGGLEIHVAEVATAVTGADEEIVARIRGASLGYAPAPGYSRVLRADLVSASLRAALPGVRVTVAGAPRCRVTPTVITVAGADLQAAAAAAVRRTLVGQDAEARPAGEIADVLVPGGDVEPRIVVGELPRIVQAGRATVPVQVWFGDRLYRSVPVPFQVSIWRRQAVLRRAINVGDSLHAGLFEVKRVEVSDALGMQALGMDQLAGAVALRPMAAGAAVIERDVHREVIAHKGDHATVQLTHGSVRVTDLCVILADGRMGERVAVRLRSTGRELVGVVRGPQHIEVKIK